MKDECKLRQKAREAIQAGKLPVRRPERTWGGPGTGACCTVCGDPVSPTEAEFELEFPRSEEDSSSRSCHVHVRCFAVWELERQNFEGDREPVSAANGPAELLRPSTVVGGVPESS